MRAPERCNMFRMRRERGDETISPPHRTATARKSSVLLRSVASSQLTTFPSLKVGQAGVGVVSGAYSCCRCV